MKSFKVRLGDAPDRDPDTPEKGYSGWAKINVPDESERIKRAMEMAREGAALESGAVDAANIEAATKIFSLAKNSVTEIELDFGDGVVITELGELVYLAEWQPIALEIVSVVTQGPKLKAILRP